MSVGVAATSEARLKADTSQSRRLATFSVLAALAVLAWHAQSKTRFEMDWQTAGFLLALVVLIRPFSRIVFILLASVEVLAIVIALPATNTNRLLQFFVFVTIVSTGIYALIRRGFRRLDSGTWLNLFQPLLRLQLVIVYALAAWHKLNFDFLNPQSSCAVFLYERTPFWNLQARGNAIRWALILGTIATEMLLPVLLSIRRTRNFAICYAVIFHISLGLSEFYAFSITMISLLFLFTPENFCDIVAEYWIARKPWARTILITGLLAVLAIIVVWTAITFGPSISEMRQLSGARPILNIVWESVAYWAWYWMLLVYLLPLALFIWLWYRQPACFQPAAHSYRPIPAIFWIIPALLIFDGLNPYLGLKTDTAFAMYSNLRSEGGTTNHLIWRHPLALANYQQDLVQIVESSDPGLSAAAQRGWPMPFFDLQKRVSGLAREGQKNISITYIRNGKLTRVEAAELDPDLARRPSLLERKLLRFRAISREGCPH